MKLHEDALAPDISPAQPEQAISGDHESSAAANKAVDPPKKITVLLSKHPSNANLLAAEEIRSLRRLGYEIALSALESTLQDSEDNSPEIRAEAEATHYVRTPGTLRRLACHLRAIFNPLPYFRLIYHAVRLDGWSGLVANRHVADVLDLSCWMRKQGIHHLHAHFGTEAACVSVLMKYFRGTTLSLTLGNPDDLHHAGPARLKQKVEAADFIICVGTATKNALMRLTHSHHWHKYDVCELGVDTLHYQPKSQKFESGVFTVLCVGQLEPHNGQRTLLEACRLLKESGQIGRAHV